MPENRCGKLGIPEDNYDFHQLGLYIAQITGLEVLDDQNNPIPFTVKTVAEDADKLDFGDTPIWREIVECEAPPITSDEKYHWTILLYFGMFKQSDNETSRFADASADENQGERAIERLNKIMTIGYETLLKEHEVAGNQPTYGKI